MLGNHEAQCLIEKALRELTERQRHQLHFWADRNAVSHVFMTFHRALDRSMETSAEAVALDNDLPNPANYPST